VYRNNVRRPGLYRAAVGWSLATMYARQKHLVLLYDPLKTCSLRENVVPGSGDI
jgi:hypothetical protein